MPHPKALRTLLLAACGAATIAAEASAQSSATLRIEENFRREPNGVVLARLTPGAQVSVVATEGNWSQIDLGGWVWLQSLGASTEDGFPLVVTADGGENLRAEPSGTIVARLEEGVLLDEVERSPGWVRVRRTGWIWSASLTMPTAGTGPAIQPPAPSQTDPGPATRRPGGFVSVPGGAPAILTAPDGDTLARATAGRDVQLLAREGSWARVRLEGWMWMPEAGAGGDTDAEAASVPEGAPLDPSDLAASPSGLNGRVVSWSLQFISVERAEAVRTDFVEGEPFLLTRYGGPDGPFVYVAVPPDRMSEVSGLVPLERISVTARVRTGASELTGTPIVDLVALERSRESP